MKYKPALIAEIEKNLKLGMNRDDTCILCGLSRETFYQWLKTKADFSDIVEKAEAENKRGMIAIIRKAAITQWTAAAWWLERKYKKEFSRIDQVDYRNIDKPEEIPEAMQEELIIGAANRIRKTGSKTISVK